MKKGTKKLKRLLRTVKSLKPEYVDDPPLKEIINSAEINDVKPPAYTVADAEAQEILNSDTPKLVNPQQDRRSILTRKMQETLEERNKYLKDLCEASKSLPVELRGEFNEWKLAGFKTTHTPQFVVFLEKARNLGKDALLDIFYPYSCFQRTHSEFVSKSHKHRTNRDDAVFEHQNNFQMTFFIVNLKSAGFPVSNAMLEWLRGEDWEHMKRFVEQELSCYPKHVSPWFHEVAGSEYYRASSVLLRVHRIRKALDSCKIAHSPDPQGYWTAVEEAWRSGSREYERLKFKEYKKLSEFEELENKFKGTNLHTYRDEFANIYGAVHAKLNALEFLEDFKSTESEQVKNKAIELGIDPENIKESHLSKFEGCPKVYNILIIKLFAIKVKEASFDQIGKLLNEHNDVFKKITAEMVSFRECNELATEIREGNCSISSEGKVSCSELLWNERVSDPKWLGYVLFKPTKPYHSSYLRGLLAREQELRQRYDHLKLVHMFINDIKPDSSVHPGRPTKRLHFSTRVFDFDPASFKHRKSFPDTRFK